MTTARAHVLHNEAEFDAALKEFEGFFDNEPERGTSEGDRFELLGVLLADYEQRHYPLAPADPIDALEAIMEMRGLVRADLARVIGQSRATEILRRRRGLSIEHIKSLRAEWGVPADALI